MPTYDVSIAEIKPWLNPLDGSLWQCGPIAETEIQQAVASGVIESRVWNDIMKKVTFDEARTFHIERIATMVRTPVTDPRIVLIIWEAATSTRGRVTCYDGNHRLAAAYIRGDTTIRSAVVAPDPNTIVEIFPTAKFIEHAASESLGRS